MRSIPARLLFILLFALIVTGTAWAAATADQYQQAGLQLYQAKDYARALPYFEAALKADPNLVAAAQGAGNCLVALNQPAQAIPYYEKALALNPADTQLATYVQNLKSQAGAAPASPVTPAPSPAGAYAQGKALLDARQYAQALPLLQQAVAENPLDANAVFYLGYCQYMTGDKRGAVVSFTRSNRLSPNATAEKYAQQVRATLAPGDAAWVDAELAKPAPTSAPAGATQVGVSAKKKSGFGIRLLPGFQMFTLGDLKADSDAVKQIVVGYQTDDVWGHGPDPSIGLEGKIASAAPALALEPCVPLGDRLELGLHFETLMVTDYDTHITNGQTGVMEYTETRRMKISALPLGLTGRFLLGATDRTVRPTLGLSVLYMISSIDYSLSLRDYTVDPADTLTANLKGNGLGGALSLGADIALGDTFRLSPFVAFRMLKVKNYKGTMNDGGVSLNGELVTLDSRSGQPGVVLVAEEGSLSDFSSPTEVDFGGLHAGLGLTLSF